MQENCMDQFMNRRDMLRLSGLSLLGVSLMKPDKAQAEDVIEADICVYGGTSTGVVATVAAHRLGKQAVLIEPGRHLGGLTSGGLGMTDTGNRGAIGGMAREFYQRVYDFYLRRYGADSEQVKDCRDGFRFEPHVAEMILNEMVKEAGAPVFFGQRLKSVKKRRNRITEIATERGTVFRAPMFIDATYEGDLMAQAKVSYTIGRESNAKYGETLNGIQFGHRGHQFRVPVDPYVVEGDPSSGLLKGISPDPPGNHGDGDHRVQAYCFRLCLTNVPENRVPFPKPKGYDPDRYALYARYINKGVFEIFGNSQRMPNNKTDTNNHGAFATDNIGMNYDYPDGDWATRQRIIEDHINYQQGLFWFLCHDERVPPRIRERVNQWGLAKDEFVDNGNWPHQLYVREARRMISDDVMTEHNCRGTVVAEDSIGLASYNMDSHHVRRIVIEGRVMNEGDVQVGVSPYPIAYRSIAPRESECANLLVPVCLSCSHIAYGSIRMEPVFMILGQSAATAAHFAIDAKTSVQKIDVKKLQEQLLKDKQILTWTGATVAAFDPKTLKGIVLDDADGKKTGEWIPSTRSFDRRVGTGYVHDGNTNKGQVAIAYTPDIPEEGIYEIILISVPNPNRATNVPVTVAIEGGESVTVKVNQRVEEHKGLASLGTFKLPKGKRTTVTLSNKDTDGYVVADGVQFVPMK
jgi:hypothetical protein